MPVRIECILDMERSREYLTEQGNTVERVTETVVLVNGELIIRQDEALLHDGAWVAYSQGHRSSVRANEAASIDQAIGEDYFPETPTSHHSPKLGSSPGPAVSRMNEQGGDEQMRAADAGPGLPPGDEQLANEKKAASRLSGSEGESAVESESFPEEGLKSPGPMEQLASGEGTTSCPDDTAAAAPSDSPSGPTSTGDEDSEKKSVPSTSVADLWVTSPPASGADLCSALEVDTFPSLLAYAGGRGAPAVRFQGTINQQSLRKFMDKFAFAAVAPPTGGGESYISSNSFVVDVGAGTMDEIMRSGQTWLVACFDIHDTNRSGWRKDWDTVAQSLRGVVKVGVVNTGGGEALLKLAESIGYDPDRDNHPSRCAAYCKLYAMDKLKPLEFLSQRAVFDPKELADFAVSHMGHHVYPVDSGSYETFMEAEGVVNPRVLLCSAKPSVPPIFKALSAEYHGRLVFGAAVQCGEQTVAAAAPAVPSTTTPTQEKAKDVMPAKSTQEQMYRVYRYLPTVYRSSGRGWSGDVHWRHTDGAVTDTTIQIDAAAAKVTVLPFLTDTTVPWCVVSSSVPTMIGLLDGSLQAAEELRRGTLKVDRRDRFESLLAAFDLSSEAFSQFVEAEEEVKRKRLELSGMEGGGVPALEGTPNKTLHRLSVTAASLVTDLNKAELMEQVGANTAKMMDGAKSLFSAGGATLNKFMKQRDKD